MFLLTTGEIAWTRFVSKKQNHLSVCLFVVVVVCLFVWRPNREYIARMETSQLPVLSPICSAATVFEQGGGIFIVPRLLWHGFLVRWSHLNLRKVRFSHLLRARVGYTVDIFKLTRVPTGLLIYLLVNVC